MVEETCTQPFLVLVAKRTVSLSPSLPRCDEMLSNPPITYTTSSNRHALLINAARQQYGCQGRCPALPEEEPAVFMANTAGRATAKESCAFASSPSSVCTHQLWFSGDQSTSLPSIIFLGTAWSHSSCSARFIKNEK